MMQLLTAVHFGSTAFVDPSCMTVALTVTPVMAIWALAIYHRRKAAYATDDFNDGVELAVHGSDLG